MLEIGILGAAGIAPSAVIVPARRRTDARVSAIASRTKERAEGYAARYGIPKAYGSYDELLADPHIDLVYVALPPSEHARWAIAAMLAGKDVLCEKPFAMNGDEAEEMVRVAHETGRRLIEAFHDHYHPLAARTAELSQTLGGVEEVEAVFLVTMEYESGTLRHEPSLGGGALMDLGTYPLHGVRQLLGDEPRVVSAEAHVNPSGADTTIAAELEFPSGAKAVIRASMAAAFENWIRVSGPRGFLEVQGVVFPSAGHTITSSIDGIERVETVSGFQTYDHQLAAVVEGLALGRPLPTEGRDPVANMRAIDAIYAAAKIR